MDHAVLTEGEEKMAGRIAVKIPKDHIGGNFEWEEKPGCCDLMTAAIETSKFVFVSNVMVAGQNSFYMQPVCADGELADEGGFPIYYCPWCGHQLDGKKKR
ncbi:hypothetical protein GCM10011385_28690 [Nitratireductor aestuarii]|uniref:Uncharacterized protein n=2 Tax=Nitratireductor aestuarii TaxID=1735103 RepID=A0A916RWT0_9HYPH|nr:hypothetical protein GCM10011385_28690 [Nitratireductor aestuarii]